MKKSLLAVAAIGAFASAAQAQSSVTVYGIMDVGYINTNYSGTSVKANDASTGNSTGVGSANQKQVTNGFGQSAESTSRIGFKGSEDLGGGTSAVFTVELGLQPMSQASTTTTNGSFLFNRQSFAGLKKNGVGTVTIGTQYTPIFDVQSQTDAAGNNNLVGNAVYSGSAQGSGVTNIGLAPYAGNTASQSLNVTTGAYTTRVSNALKFQSDTFAGFTGQAYYAQANETQTYSAANSVNGGGQNNNTLWGLNGKYTWNKLDVVAATQNVKSLDNQATTVGSTSTYAGGTANSFGSNMVDTQTYAAATYDFGILKAYYQYITRRVNSATNDSYSSKRSANQIGVRSQLTPVISAYATYGLTNSTYWGQSLPSANGRTYQVGVDYYLSKRTNLYVAGGAANQSSNGTTAAGTTNIGAGSSASNYAVGVRHTF